MMLKFLKKEDDQKRQLKKPIQSNIILPTTNSLSLEAKKTQKKPLINRNFNLKNSKNLDSAKSTVDLPYVNTNDDKGNHESTQTSEPIMEECETPKSSKNSTDNEESEIQHLHSIIKGLNQQIESLNKQFADLQTEHRNLLNGKTQPDTNNESKLKDQIIEDLRTQVESFQKKNQLQQAEEQGLSVENMNLMNLLQQEQSKSDQFKKERDDQLLENSNLRVELDSVREQLKQQQEVNFNIRSQLDFVMQDEEALKRMQDRRMRIILEIEETEATYVSGLSLVVDYYLLPLRNSKDNLLPEPDIPIIFNNIEELYRVANTLYENIRERTSLGIPFNFADVLLRSFQDANYSKQYIRYINGCDKAISMIGNLSTTKEKKLTAFGQFLKDNQDQPLSRKLPLESYLTTPVQRVPRYVLLLKDLANNTDPSHVDYENVVSALHAATSLASLINESKREAEHLERLEVALVSYSKGGKAENFTLNYDPTRKLIAEGPIGHLLTNGTHKQRTLILLSDVVLCASKVREKYEFKWKAHLINCVLQYTEENGVKKMQLTELRKIPTYPFTLNVSFTLVPSLTIGPGSGTGASTGDFEFWKSAFEKAFATFWVDGDKKLIENAGDMKRHMAENLLQDKDWAKLHVVTEKITFAKDELILAEGDRSCVSKISHGRVRVEKIINGESIVLTTIAKNEFFGEMAYLEKKKDKKRAAASVYSDEDETVILKMEEDRLNALLVENPRLAERFFKLLCYILAERFVQRPLENALKKKNAKAGVPAPLPAAESGPGTTPPNETTPPNASSAPSNDTSTNEQSQSEDAEASSPPSSSSSSVISQSLDESKLVVHLTPVEGESPSSNSKRKRMMFKESQSRSISELRLDEPNSPSPPSNHTLPVIVEEPPSPHSLTTPTSLTSTSNWSSMAAGLGTSSSLAIVSPRKPSGLSPNRGRSPTLCTPPTSPVGGTTTTTTTTLPQAGRLHSSSMSYTTLPSPYLRQTSGGSPPRPQANNGSPRGKLLNSAVNAGPPAVMNKALLSAEKEGPPALQKRRPSLAALTRPPPRTNSAPTTTTSKEEENRKSIDNEAENLETSRKKKREGLTAQLLKRLKLEGEVLGEFSCGLKGRKHSSGSFVITGEAFGYYSQIFGRKTRIKIPFRELKENQIAPRADDNLLLIRSASASSAGFHEFVFLTKLNRDQATNIIIARLHEIANSASGTNSDGGGSFIASSNGPFEEENNLNSTQKSTKGFKLSPSDWDELFSCASVRTYCKDEFVLRQDDQQQQLYQIIHGSCCVVRSFRAPNSSSSGDIGDGKSSSQVVGRVEEGDIFGELSFILGGRATASIVADSQGDLSGNSMTSSVAGGSSSLALSGVPVVKVFSFERAKLETLFSHNPRIATGFYYYLARQIRDRFLKVQNALQQSQSMSS